MTRHRDAATGAAALRAGEADENNAMLTGSAEWASASDAATTSRQHGVAGTGAADSAVTSTATGLGLAPAVATTASEANTAAKSSGGLRRCLTS